MTGLPLSRLLPILDPGGRAIVGRVPVEEAVATLVRHRTPLSHLTRDDGPGCGECDRLRALVDVAWVVYEGRLRSDHTRRVP